jgi:hypothetical protein
MSLLKRVTQKRRGAELAEKNLSALFVTTYHGDTEGTEIKPVKPLCSPCLPGEILERLRDTVFFRNPLPSDHALSPKTTPSLRRPRPLSEDHALSPKTTPSLRRPHPLSEDHALSPKTTPSLRKPRPLSENHALSPIKTPVE